MDYPSSRTTIDICICTFRRPHLAQTLQSISLQKVPADCRIHLIIADNDEIPSAQKLVETIAGSFPYPIHYIHAPARNISIARNACLNAATSSFIAFIDDDEIASPEWLAELLARQSQSKANVVLGPVQSRYPASAPAWLREGDFHSIKPVWVKGKIITGYTSNVLFRREALSLQDLQFIEQLGQSGGEDTAFFSAVHRAGGSIDYAAKAVVMEDVAPERLTFVWLLKRYFRSGQTHGMILLANTGSALGSRLNHLVLDSAKTLFCGVMAIGAAIMGRNQHRWLLRGSLHAGVVARLLGKPELKQYG